MVAFLHDAVQLKISKRGENELEKRYCYTPEKT
jgi:hypothetical protein